MLLGRQKTVGIFWASNHLNYEKFLFLFYYFINLFYYVLGIMVGMGIKMLDRGHEAYSRRALLNLSYPIQRAVWVNMDEIVCFFQRKIE